MHAGIDYATWNSWLKRELDEFLAVHEPAAIVFDGNNPYPGALGWADRLVVTPDSVNMLSEACAVGCAVHTFVSGNLPAKLARFHRSLREAGLLHDIDEDAPVQQAPLRETAAIAEVLRKRVFLR